MKWKKKTGTEGVPRVSRVQTPVLFLLFHCCSLSALKDYITFNSRGKETRGGTGESY